MIRTIFAPLFRQRCMSIVLLILLFGAFSHSSAQAAPELSLTHEREMPMFFSRRVLLVYAYMLVRDMPHLVQGYRSGWEPGPPQEFRNLWDLYTEFFGLIYLLDFLKRCASSIRRPSEFLLLLRDTRGIGRYSILRSLTVLLHDCLAVGGPYLRWLNEARGFSLPSHEVMFARLRIAAEVEDSDAQKAKFLFNRISEEGEAVFKFLITYAVVYGVDKGLTKGWKYFSPTRFLNDAA